MKKVYIKPASHIVKVNTSSIMQASMTLGGSTNQNLSRKGSSHWDDDDDDEY